MYKFELSTFFAVRLPNIADFSPTASFLAYSASNMGARPKKGSNFSNFHNIT